jgi:hypothetical protein
MKNLPLAESNKIKKHLLQSLQNGSRPLAGTLQEKQCKSQVNLFPTYCTSTYVKVTATCFGHDIGHCQGIHVTQRAYTFSI